MINATVIAGDELDEKVSIDKDAVITSTLNENLESDSEDVLADSSEGSSNRSSNVTTF